MCGEDQRHVRPEPVGRRCRCRRAIAVYGPECLMRSRRFAGVAVAALLGACGGGESRTPQLSVLDDAFAVPPLEFGQVSGSEVDPLANDTVDGGPAQAGADGNVRVELLGAPDGASLTEDGRRILVARHGTGVMAIRYRVCTLRTPSVCAPGLARVTVTRGRVQAAAVSVRGWTGDVVVGHSDLEVQWPVPVPGELRVSDSGAVRIADHALPGRFRLQRRLCEPGVSGNCATQDIVVEVPVSVAVQGVFSAGERGAGFPEPASWWSGTAQGTVDFGAYAADGCSGSPDFSSSCNFALPFTADDLLFAGGELAFGMTRPLSWPTGFRMSARPGQRVTLPSHHSLATGAWPVPGASATGMPTARVLRYAQGSRPTVGAVPANGSDPSVPLRWQTGSLHRNDGSRPVAAHVALGLLRGQWPATQMEVADGPDGSAMLNMLAGAFFDVRDDNGIELRAEGGFQLQLPPWGARTRLSGSDAPMFRFDASQARWISGAVRATADADGFWHATVDQPGLWAVADLLPMVQVSGCVQDPWRRPVAHATIRLRARGQTTQALARTDADGRFVVGMGGLGAADLVAVRDVSRDGGSALPTYWNDPQPTFMTESEVQAPHNGVSDAVQRESVPLPMELSGAADQRLDRCLQVEADPLLGAHIHVGNGSWRVRETVWALPDGTRRSVVNRSPSRVAVERLTALQVGRYSLFSSVVSDGASNPGDAADFHRATELWVPGQAPVRVSLSGVDRHREEDGRYWHLLDIDVGADCKVTVVPRRTLVDALPPLAERYSVSCVPR